MPFKKVGKDDFTSPSGRHFNGAQVRLWHAHGGKFPGQKGEGEMSGYSKGGDVRPANYAAGGPVLGRTREFLKEENHQHPVKPSNTPTSDVYPKKGKGEQGRDKSLKAVKPR